MNESNKAPGDGQGAVHNPATTTHVDIDIDKLTDKVYQLMRAEMSLALRKGIVPLRSDKRRR